MAAIRKDSTSSQNKQYSLFHFRCLNFLTHDKMDVFLVCKFLLLQIKIRFLLLLFRTEPRKGQSSILVASIVGARLNRAYARFYK